MKGPALATDNWQPATPLGDTMDGKTIDSTNLLELGKAAPEAAVARVVRFAVELGAGDLFLNAGEQHVTVQMRHLGIMRPLSVLPLEHGRRCLAHVKAMAQMDTAERRRPQDGRWIVTLDPNRQP